MQKNNELPQGWAEIEFKKIVKNIPLTGKKLKQKEYLEKGKLPVIDQGQDLIGGYTDEIDLKANYSLPVIIFGDHTKIIKFIDHEFIAGADGVKVLEPKKPLNSKLIYYLTQAISLPNKGYARHYQYLEKSKIHVPPLNEQKRIVEKIEKLFSLSDSLKETLEKTKILLKRYRQTLFNDLFEGNFNIKELELDVKLWNRVPYGDVCNRITYGFTNPMPDSDEGPWKITAVNVRNGKINYDGARKTDWDSFRNLLTDKSRPVVGTVVIIKDGATIGRVGIIDRENTCISQSLGSLEPNDKIISEFLAFSLQSLKVRQYIEKYQRAVAMPHISMTDLAKWEFLLPPKNHQEKIVKFLEYQLSKIEKSEKHVESLSRQCNAMKSSILKQAFEGKLVPQDPNDEPASELLKRIKIQ